MTVTAGGPTTDRRGTVVRHARGYALAIVILVLVLMLLTLFTVVSVARRNAVEVKDTRHGREAFYVVDGGARALAKHIGVALYKSVASTAAITQADVTLVVRDFCEGVGVSLPDVPDAGTAVLDIGIENHPECLEPLNDGKVTFITAIAELASTSSTTCPGEPRGIGVVEGGLLEGATAVTTTICLTVEARPAQGDDASARLITLKQRLSLQLASPFQIDVFVMPALDWSPTAPPDGLDESRLAVNGEATLGNVSFDRARFAGEFHKSGPVSVGTIDVTMDSDSPSWANNAPSAYQGRLLDRHHRVGEVELLGDDGQPGSDGAAAWLVAADDPLTAFTLKDRADLWVIDGSWFLNQLGRKPVPMSQRTIYHLYSDHFGEHIVGARRTTAGAFPQPVDPTDLPIVDEEQWLQIGGGTRVHLHAALAGVEVAYTNYFCSGNYPLPVDPPPTRGLYSRYEQPPIATAGAPGFEKRVPTFGFPSVTGSFLTTTSFGLSWRCGDPGSPFSPKTYPFIHPSLPLPAPDLFMFTRPFQDNSTSAKFLVMEANAEDDGVIHYGGLRCPGGACVPGHWEDGSVCGALPAGAPNPDFLTATTVCGVLDAARTGFRDEGAGDTGNKRNILPINVDIEALSRALGLDGAPRNPPLGFWSTPDATGRVDGTEPLPATIAHLLELADFFLPQVGDTMPEGRDPNVVGNKLEGIIYISSTWDGSLAEPVAVYPSRAHGDWPHVAFTKDSHASMPRRNRGPGQTDPSSGMYVPGAGGIPAGEDIYPQKHNVTDGVSGTIDKTNQRLPQPLCGDDGALPWFTSNVAPYAPQRQITTGSDPFLAEVCPDPLYSASSNDGVSDLADAPRPNAVRLYNGADLTRFKDTGLTIITDLPVYIIGDWNTVLYTPAGGGPEREVPSMIVADSVTFLPEDWTDESAPWDDSASPSGSASVTARAAFVVNGPSTGGVSGAAVIVEPMPFYGIGVTEVEIKGAVLVPRASRHPRASSAQEVDITLERSPTLNRIDGQPPGAPMVATASADSWRLE